MGSRPNKASFWTTIPGILTGIAALIGAITGLLAATGHLPVQLNTSHPQTIPNNNKNVTTNQPPVADIVSQSPAMEGQHVYLNGSGEDPDGDKLSYSWKQISGLPRVRIFDETNPTASFYAPSDVIRDTNLTFELTVYDNRGMEDKSNTTVTVLYNRYNDIQLFISRGYGLLTLGRYSDAIDSFNKSLAIDPNNTLALDDKANALISLGHNVEAKRIEDKSLSLNNSDTIALANEAAILYDSQNYTGALKYYDKALSIDPNSAWTLNRKGLTLYNLRNYTGAVHIYDKALSINHTYTEAQDNRKAALDALKTSKQ